ncbi:hypothetical protein ACWGB8_02410 [Kitasatospora sp. NPDC054939]
MYAIKVVLQPRTGDGSAGCRPWGEAAERIRSDPRCGIAHVSLVSVPPHLVAMTFVTAADLLAAEELAGEAWRSWLRGERFTGWRLLSCEGDLQLGVWAAKPSIVPDVD